MSIPIESGGTGLEVLSQSTPELKNLLIQPEADDNSVVIAPEIFYPFFFREAGDQSFFRGARQERSVSRVVSTSPVISECYKGGEIHPDSLGRMVYKDLERIVKGEMPGGLAEVFGILEYDKTQELQNLALETLGRPTYVPIPNWVRNITTVSYDGKDIPIEDFIRTHYLSSEDEMLREFIDGQDKDELAQKLISMNPSQFAYQIRGLNIRTNELPSTLIFTQSKRYFSDYSDMLFNFQGGEVGTYEGGEFAMFNSPDSFITLDEIIRRSYQALFEAYGLEMGDIFPKSEIKTENFVSAIQYIQHNIALGGADYKIMHMVANALAEVAALGHIRGGNTFSSTRKPNMGGALISRNVTMGGMGWGLPPGPSVVDLGTIMPLPMEGDGINVRGLEQTLDPLNYYIQKDIQEAGTAVAALSRMFSPVNRLDFYFIFLKAYEDRVVEFEGNDRIKEVAIKATKSDFVREIQEPFFSAQTLL